MKTALLTLALVVLPLLSSGGASLKMQIAASDKRVDAALKSGDIKKFAHAVAGVVTPDFQYIDDGSKPMNFDGMVAGMKQGLSMYPKITNVSTSLVTVKQTGNKGSAIEKHLMAGLVPGPDKKLHTMVYTGTSTETFRKVKGKWLMASMNMKTDKLTMDGKPMQMRAR